MTLRLSARAEFKPGQFMNLGLHLPTGFVSRSYSLASTPGEPLEVLLARVGEGALTPALFELQPGASVTLDDKPQGFFTFDYVPPHRELWLLATGTGLGPFLSMLRSGAAFGRAERVVLVHGTRGAAELAHRDELQRLAAERGASFRYLPTLSQETDPSLAHGRLTTLLSSGALEALAQTSLSPDSAHVMLCGNPQMIDDVIALLAARGMKRHRQRVPGHITTEKYW
ncbi:MAG: ferredoxin--NADP(+) reductase [Polyangiaceae bacterium]|jgi:ferredoxin--NADP+ reductase|nr:ferredoxin--NADP(+) reductase [Polyangiaceae bacterium]